eukprot:767556-Hanusia_phi.AAC.9
MKAKEQAKVTHIMCAMGETSSPTESSATMGSSIAVAATLELHSVMSDARRIVVSLRKSRQLPPPPGRALTRRSQAPAELSQHVRKRGHRGAMGGGGRRRRGEGEKRRGRGEGGEEEEEWKRRRRGRGEERERMREERI